MVASHHDRIDGLVCRNGAFSSRHPGGTQFVFTDGHTRLISENIDLSVFRHLTTIAGGESVDLGD